MTPALPPADHAARRDRLRHSLAERGLAGLYVTSPPNVRYLTGFTGSNGQVIVTLDPAGDALITDPRYTERAAVEAPDVETVIDRDPVPIVFERTDGTVGFEPHGATWSVVESLRSRASEAGVSAEPTDRLVEALRRVKDDHEVAALRAACAITTAALEALFVAVEPGVTERELAIGLERSFLDLGADGVAFPSIVAAGPNSAIPHHEPTARQVASGDLVKIDCGARVAGYHADVTRTVAVGEPGQELRRIHDLVREAQAAGVAAAVAGVSCEDVDRAAREPIEAAGHGEHFVHGIGHGVGLEIHEDPIVSAEPGATLAARTAITVEPGVYLPGVGGVRIEDTLIVTAGPADVLTDHPRELSVL